MRLPGRYATVRWQIWQRVTGRWVTVTGKRREGDLLICFYDVRPAELILHGAHAARTPRGMTGYFSTALTGVSGRPRRAETSSPGIPAGQHPRV